MTAVNTFGMMPPCSDPYSVKEGPSVRPPPGSSVLSPHKELLGLSSRFEPDLDFGQIYRTRDN
jgi:hypothetical protein